MKIEMTQVRIRKKIWFLETFLEMDQVKYAMSVAGEKMKQVDLL